MFGRRPAIPDVARFQTRPRDARRAARARVTLAVAMSEYHPPLVSTRPMHLGRSEKSRVARREALALVAELDSFVRLKSTRAANLVRDTRVGLDAAAPSAGASPPRVDLSRFCAFDPDPATRRRSDPLEPSDATTAAGPYLRDDDHHVNLERPREFGTLEPAASSAPASPVPTLNLAANSPGGSARRTPPRPLPPQTPRGAAWERDRATPPPPPRLRAGSSPPHGRRGRFDFKRIDAVLDQVRHRRENTGVEPTAIASASSPPTRVVQTVRVPELDPAESSSAAAKAKTSSESESESDSDSGWSSDDDWVGNAPGLLHGSTPDQIVKSLKENAAAMAAMAADVRARVASRVDSVTRKARNDADDDVDARRSTRRSDAVAPLPNRPTKRPPFDARPSRPDANTFRVEPSRPEQSRATRSNLPKGARPAGPPVSSSRRHPDRKPDRKPDRNPDRKSDRKPDPDDALLRELRRLRSRLRRRGGDLEAESPPALALAGARGGPHAARRRAIAHTLALVEDAAATRIQALARGASTRAELPKVIVAATHRRARRRSVAAACLATWATRARARRRLRARARELRLRGGARAHFHLGGCRDGACDAWDASEEWGVAGVADRFRRWRGVAFAFARWREWAVIDAPREEESEAIEAEGGTSPWRVAPPPTASPPRRRRRARRESSSSSSDSDFGF